MSASYYYYYYYYYGAPLLLLLALWCREASGGDGGSLMTAVESSVVVASPDDEREDLRGPPLEGHRSGGLPIISDMVFSLIILVSTFLSVVVVSCPRDQQLTIRRCTSP